MLDRWKIGPSAGRIPYYFCGANAASLVALVACLSGKTGARWEPQR